MLPYRAGAALTCVAALCTLTSGRLPLAPQAASAPAPVPHVLSDSGAFLSVVRPGDVVITEFMKDPSAVSDGSGEWIEIHNNLEWRVDLEGVLLSDGGSEQVVLDNGGNGILIAPGDYFVLGNNADPNTNGGVEVDFEYSGFTLKNSTDQIRLNSPAGYHLDSVRYDDGVLWPDSPGKSISLDPSVLDPWVADDPSLWCHSTSVMGGGDTGTPGAANDACL